MRTRYLMLLFALVLALVPAVAFAADDPDDGSFVMKVDGNFTVAPDDEFGTVVVASGDVLVQGTITDTLVVIDGDATVADGARLTGDVYVFSGTLTLADGSTVENVMLWDSTLARGDAATVTGEINRDLAGDLSWTFGVFSVLFWIGTTFFVLVAGVLFALIGRRQLLGAGRLLSDEPGAAVIATLLFWIGLPFASVALFATIIGIPVAIGLLLFVLPAFWFLGYLTIGTRFGALIIARSLPEERPAHAPVAAVVGLLILQLVGLVPWFGGFVAFLAGVVGAGLLTLAAWRAWRGPKTTTTPLPTTSSTQAPLPI